MDVDEYATDLIAAADTRNEAMRSKNAKQEVASAEKEILRLGRAAVASGASKGAVVSLHVDYRTNAHAQGLVAIVYDVKNTGGILVCCEHGIITHDGSVKDYGCLPTSTRCGKSCGCKRNGMSCHSGCKCNGNC